jgi:hypothetical protein
MLRPSIDDLDCDALISRPSPPDRIAFHRAAEEALARVPCRGEELYIERSPAYSERSSSRLPSTALAVDRDGRRSLPN